MFELGTILKRLVINDLFVCIFKLVLRQKTVVFELGKHAVSGSLLNMLREKPVKIVKVQYTEA